MVKLCMGRRCSPESNVTPFKILFTCFLFNLIFCPLYLMGLAAIKTRATGFLCVWFSLWTIGLTLYDQFLTSSSFTHEYTNSEYPPPFLYVISWIWFPVLNLLVCHNLTRMSQYCKYSALPILHPIQFLVSCCERGFVVGGFKLPPFHLS